MNTNTYNRIQKYLYNYKNIDKTIESIKFDMLDYNHFGYNNWLKSISNNAKTLEDKIIDIDNNRVILKLRKWKKLISDVLENYIKYQYICLKYFDNNSWEEIQSKLKLNRKKQKDMQVEILQHIFLLAIRNNLLKEY